MRNREKLTEMLIDSFKPVESDDGVETPENNDADTIDIDALENRIMERIESKFKQRTQPDETPVTNENNDDDSSTETNE